jgi:hypothetical protein
MGGRTIDEMRKGSKYDTVSASIIYAGNDAVWSMEPERVASCVVVHVSTLDFDVRK